MYIHTSGRINWMLSDSQCTHAINAKWAAASYYHKKLLSPALPSQVAVDAALRFPRCRRSSKFLPRKLCRLRLLLLLLLLHLQLVMLRLLFRL